MKPRLLLLILLLLLCLTADTAIAAGSNPLASVREKWALIVGIGQFQDSALKPLAYGISSAKELCDVLEDSRFGHFTPGHIHLLLNSSATRYGIERSATENWLFRKALPNDVIIVYIATRMIEREHAFYLCAADSIASDITTTGISLEPFLKNLKNRTQSKRIVCILDTMSQTKPGAGAAAGSLQELVNRTGVSVLCAQQWASTSAESPLIHYLCENVKTTQGSTTLPAISQYVNRNLEETRAQGIQSIVMHLAPDNDFLTVIPLGLPIKNSSPVEQLHFGHPVGTLALDRPDLDQMINTHHPETPNNDSTEGSFSQINCAAYLGRMKKCIQTKWQPPNGFEDRSVAAIFTIAKDGTIGGATVVASSGNAAVDNSALAALKAASPLEPLPPGFPESVQIRYKFKWHIKAGAAKQ